MRVNGEIDKQEYSSLKAKINGEMLIAEKEIDDIKRVVLEEERKATPLVSIGVFRSMAVEDLDFTKPIRHSALVNTMIKKSCRTLRLILSGILIYIRSVMTRATKTTKKL